MKEPDPFVNEVSYKVIGAALEVHRTLGPGFLESVYEEALCIGLRERGIQYVNQKVIDVAYKGFRVGESRLDIFVENCLIVELKVVETLLPIHTAQVISYLKMTNLSLGLLINFNTSVLKNTIRRIALS